MDFVFDLDGTLCFDRMTIAEDIKETLYSAPSFGHEVTFASARSYRDCIDLLGNELTRNRVIGLNGGLAYQDAQLIFHRHLTKTSYELALTWCHHHGLPYFVDDDFNYAHFRGQKIPFISSVDPLGLASRLDIAELHNPIKTVIYMGDHENLIEPFMAELNALQEMDVDYHAHEKCLYLNPFETNKATTIIDCLGHNFVAFGNDKNDIAMFQASAHAVQVGDFALLRPFADEMTSAAHVFQKIQDVFERFSHV